MAFIRCILSAFAAFALLAIVAAKPCLTGCDIKSGYTPDQCDYYSDNSDWLPPNYVSATKCVCSDESLNYPSINCVRKKLQELHKSEFSDAFKQIAAQKLDDFINMRISEGEYRAWSDMQFADRVRQIHIRAFDSCCCLGTPASAYFWHGIFLWSPAPCMITQGGQHLLSSCDCTGED